jgi:hypothetical protein
MARSSGKGLKVNPVSLMETIYNFVSFSGEVIADFKEALKLYTYKMTLKIYI